MLGKEEFLCTRQNKITSKTLGVILLVGNVRKKKLSASYDNKKPSFHIDILMNSYDW